MDFPVSFAGQFNKCFLFHDFSEKKHIILKAATLNQRETLAHP